MILLGDLGADKPGIEKLRAIQAGRRPAIAETFDMRLIEIGDRSVALESTPDPRFYNPLGTMHGGYCATLLDTACGFAVLSGLPAGQAFTTLELKVAYHKPITAETGPLRTEGRVTSMGRRVAFTEAKVLDRAGALLASATSTLLIVEG